MMRAAGANCLAMDTDHLGPQRVGIVRHIAEKRGALARLDTESHHLLRRQAFEDRARFSKGCGPFLIFPPAHLGFPLRLLAPGALPLLRQAPLPLFATLVSHHAPNGLA